VNDKVSATVALATGVDPRSTNQTLTDGMNRKTVGIDQAYGDWKPINGLTVSMGKTPYPWTRVGGSEWDPDITWEGTSVRYEHGAFFGTAIGSWLSNSTGAKDVTLFGGQVGMKGEAGGAKLLGAIGYFDVGGAEGQITTTTSTCAANTAFFGGPQGNSTFTDANGCARLANDFNIVEAIGQAEFKVGHYPSPRSSTICRTSKRTISRPGYSVGVYLGKAADPHTWEVGYYYQLTEKDSQFGQFMESDFGGRHHGHQGQRVQVRLRHREELGSRTRPISSTSASSTSATRATTTAGSSTLKLQVPVSDRVGIRMRGAERSAPRFLFWVLRGAPFRRAWRIGKPTLRTVWIRASQRDGFSACAAGARARSTRALLHGSP
jgi:hypothetical protein